MFGFGAPEHPQYPVISFICTVIILLPISSHWKARNVATLSMIFWLFITNLVRCVNTLVWANNVIPRYKIWCDITTKLYIGVTIALPAAALCICKYLEQIASIRQTRPTKEQKKARMRFEAFMCFGLPAIVMALHYTTQGHRFDIYEHFGCQPATVVTWVAILVLFVPPLLLSLIAFVYAGFAIRHFYYRRLDFIRLLQQSNTGMSANRYVRLMLLALTEMIIDTAVNIWILVSNIALWRGLVPYESWASIHYNFSRIQPYPEVAVPKVFWRNTIATWYIIPVATVTFWAFFAFGQESMAEYRAWGVWFRRVILRKPVAPSGDSLPSTRKYNPYGSSGNTDEKNNNGFLSKLRIPGFSHRGGNSGGLSASSSGSSSNSPTTPTTPHGQKFELSFRNGGKGTGKDLNDDSMADGESFVSADDKDKNYPLSPLSPVTPVVSNSTNNRSRMPASYGDIDLDTSVFDTISHISDSDVPPVPSIPQPAAYTAGRTPITRTRSNSLEIQEYQRRTPSPTRQVQRQIPGTPVTFGDTAVLRSTSPDNALSRGVKVEVDINVV